LPLELAGFINPAFNKSLTMNIIHYKSVGFELVGKMVKDPAQGKKKHNVYVSYVDDFDPKKKKGVYIIANSLQVLKIGESENLHHRFQCYESHSGPTNMFIRESMENLKEYGIYFIECPSIKVGYGGVIVDSGIQYKDLEKKLLLQYKESVGKVPMWNKGIQ